MDQQRKDFLIAKSLWEFGIDDAKKPIERQSPNDVSDMNQILDEDYPGLLSTLINMEKYKDRT